MRVEWSSGLVDRARVHAALGESAQLADIDQLVLGDASPSEIGRDLGLPSNLLDHHVKLLEQAGVAARSRSVGDHRAITRRSCNLAAHATIPHCVSVLATRHTWRQLTPARDQESS
jgi:predicted transcriptional regulator